MIGWTGAHQVCGDTKVRTWKTVIITFKFYFSNKMMTNVLKWFLFFIFVNFFGFQFLFFL